MIQILSQDVVNKIAAGEVVERPASVLKELIENSLDAGATDIKVYIEESGSKKIQVIDNGSGIPKEDFEKVFLKHATSKIQVIDELESIESFGFRGEALASISSVSEVILETKHGKDQTGSKVEYRQGAIQSIKPSAVIKGTNIQILHLFENIPARKKFLKSSSTENKLLIEVFNKFALANPSVSFYLHLDNTVKNYPISDSQNRIASILKFQSSNLLPLFYDGVVKISGFAVHPKEFLRSKGSQYIFVNGRPVQDSTIYKAIIDGFDTFLMKNQYPGFVIFLQIPGNQVDINVHPRKTEVRFANPSEVYKSVRYSINTSLVKHLRQETLKKLETVNVEENLNTPVKDITVFQKRIDSTVIHVTENDVQKGNSAKDPAQDFESFLLRDSSSSDQKPSQIKSNFVTEKALLFNHELIKDEKITEAQNNGLFLDIANATQLLNSYILTSSNNSILVIDQHAASERYFYEKYLKELKEKKVPGKVLLFPEVITLPDYDIKILEDNIEILQELGFEIEVFGQEEIKIIQVPEFIKMDNFRKVVERIIHDILENAEITNIKDKIFHETAAILACHTAVRFGDKLEKNEIITILRNLTTCEDPYNCPHGRPVIQEWTKYEIEKKFKRCGI